MFTFGPNGITAITENAVNAMITGARKYKNLSDRLVQMSCLNSIFPASASAWNKPSGPATLGPLRVCNSPSPRRSTQSAMITERIRKMTINSALISVSHHVSSEKSAGT